MQTGSLDGSIAVRHSASLNPQIDEPWQSREGNVPWVQIMDVHVRCTSCEQVGALQGEYLLGMGTDLCVRCTSCEQVGALQGEYLLGMGQTNDVTAVSRSALCRVSI